MKKRITTKLLITIATSTVALLINTGVQAEIYKWTDAKGVVHYSANKPTQRKVKSENIESEILLSAGKSQKKNKSPSITKKKSSNDKKKVKLSGPNKELVSYCSKQRTNLDQLQKNFRNVWQGMDGKKTTLNQKQRQEKVDYLTRRIVEDCSDIK